MNGIASADFAALSVPKPMTVPFSTVSHRGGSKRSSALIVTLVILALVTILVVSLTSMVGAERITTRESFENQRARELAGIAVDEVVATLHDNIPATNLWAVAPGRLTYMTNGAFNTVFLCSGVATGTTTGTGQVDLNAPVLGSSPTVYPIAAPNTEYPTAPQMPVAWVEVLQDGSIIRNGATSTVTPTKNNPIIGRYAYWVDTETSKVNLNTAGRGQTTYSFSYDPASGNFPSAGNDLQNLTGSPSRVDLSQLDGNITPAQSRATFHYTYGGYWLPDTVNDTITSPVFTALNSPTPTPNFATYPQGMHRFNNIADWALMPTTDSLFTATAVSRISASTQIEPNKFYLTTHSRAPELTPWGYNKMWLQVTDENTTTNGLPYMGNRLNGKGVPYYPSSTAVGYVPGFPGVSESRYYYTPYLKSTVPGSDLIEPSRYEGSMRNMAAFINNMMVQLNRTDWPGFAGQSFVQKYGQKECEDLAYNLICLYDGGVRAQSIAPSAYGPSHDSRNYWADTNGVYGGKSIFGPDQAGNDSSPSTAIDGGTRLFAPIGEWPTFNEISVGFQGGTGASTTGYTESGTTNADSFAGTIGPVSPGDTAWVTKYTDRPGFAGTLSANDIKPPYSAINIIISPQIQVTYPPGFKNPYYSGFSKGSYAQSGSLWLMCDIGVVATGTFNGQPVTYGWNTPPSTYTPLGSGRPVHNPPPYYYWGPCDNYGGFSGLSAGYNPLLGIGSSSYPSPQTISFPAMYIGPFTYGTMITDIQFRARFVELAPNVHTARIPVEIAPLAYNFPSASSGGYTSGTATLLNENETFTNVFGTTGANGQPYSPTFLFEVKNMPTSSVTGTYVTYEVSDPRVYRYTNDWTMRSDALGITPTPQSYTNSCADPVTGITGDDSKLAWPDLGLSYYNYLYEKGPPQNETTGDNRYLQSANNIQSFPGIGWLSLLPLNCESSQGSPTSSTGGSGQTFGTPIPWRTLSLEANKSGKIPDWILLEAFAVAYDQTFCSHTEGKMNVNTPVTAAFPAGTTIAPRTKPLGALIAPSSYPAAGTNDLAPMSSATLASITNAITQGPGTTYSSLPSDIFMYPGQLCELNLQANSGATNQLQRESLMRSILGTLTTQSSDFLVHVVAQSVKQVNFNPTVDPVTDLQVTSEQRMSALVSRLPDLGPDGIPDSGWTNSAMSLNSSLADESVTLGVTNSPPMNTTGVTGTISGKWVTSAPAFRFKVSDIQYATSE